MARLIVFVLYLAFSCKFYSLYRGVVLSLVLIYVVISSLVLKKSWLICCAAFAQPSSPFGSQSMFGQTSTSGTNPFSPKPFGSPNPFGSQTGSSIFGSTSTGVFGQPSTPAFGASPSPAFGSPMPAFGASSTPAFGSSSSSFGGEYISNRQLLVWS